MAGNPLLMIPLAVIYMVLWWVVVGIAAVAVIGLCVLALIAAISGGDHRGKN